MRKLWKNPLKEERGIALLMVLWVLVLIGLIASEFSYSMRTEATITRNFREEAEARALAKGALALAMEEFLKNYDYTLLSHEGETLFRKAKTLEEEEPSPSTADHRKDLALGRGKVSYAIIDEERKININTAGKELWGKLLELAGVEEGRERSTIIDSIEDWKDGNDLHRLNGAESSYYLSLPEPYRAKNGLFDTVEELLLVKGMDSSILYGDGKDHPGIARFLTVYGSGSLNLNTASEEILEIVKGETKAKEIIKKREENKGYYDQNQKSNYFTVKAEGDVDGTLRKIEMVCRKVGSGSSSEVVTLYWNDDAD